MPSSNTRGKNDSWQKIRKTQEGARGRRTGEDSIKNESSATRGEDELNQILSKQVTIGFYRGMLLFRVRQNNDQQKCNLDNNFWGKNGTFEN